MAIDIKCDFMNLISAQVYFLIALVEVRFIVCTSIFIGVAGCLLYSIKFGGGNQDRTPGVVTNNTCDTG